MMTLCKSHLQHQYLSRRVVAYFLVHLSLDGIGRNVAEADMSGYGSLRMTVIDFDPSELVSGECVCS